MGSKNQAGPAMTAPSARPGMATRWPRTHATCAQALISLCLGSSPSLHTHMMHVATQEAHFVTHFCTEVA